MADLMGQLTQRNNFAELKPNFKANPYTPKLHAIT